jgi:transposase
MHIKTILNRLQKHKGFVYGNIRLIDTKKGPPTLEIQLRAHAASRPICSLCGAQAPGYDTLPPRRFEFIPFWGILVFFVYAMRRVQCPQCGIKVERVPWAKGKSPICTTYAWFLASWAKRLCWSQVAEVFHTSWYHVADAVEMAVNWGREHMNLEGITAIGVDEIAWASGHTYATVVYQINADCKRLLWIGEKRTVKTFLSFFHWLGKERSARIQFVASDMWKAYLKVIAKKIPQAIHVLDRFHIVAHLNKALDRVRATEAREMKRKGLEPVLKHCRWALLKRVVNLTRKQGRILDSLLPHNLKTVKAYLMKQDFQQFWEYISADQAGRFLDAWCRRAMYSKIVPFKEVARMLRDHRDLILNWFRAKKEFSCGVVEGLNNKVKLTTRKSYGCGTFKTLQVSLYHTLGRLPEPKVTHKFF